jgi:hypothetical protein
LIREKYCPSTVSWGEIFPSAKNFFPEGKTWRQILSVRRTTRIVDGWLGGKFSLGEKVFPDEEKSVFPSEKLCSSIRLLGKLLRGTT